MRIHRIALRNYRGVPEADVSLPATGVTIIEGSNEIGKTSIIEALHLLLEVRDDSTAASVRNIHPVGTDESPEVTVELSTGPYRLTYAKRWHRKFGSTTLSISEPHRQHLNGRDAHQRVEQILAETMDHDLWKALRLEQGDGPSAAPLGRARSLSQALDLAVGGDAESDKDDALRDRIVAERDRYWYATGKPRAEGVELRRQLVEAEARRARVEADLAALDRQAEDAARLETEGLQLARQVLEAQQEVTDLTGRAARVAELRAEAQRVAAGHAAAASEERRLVALRDRRTELVAHADRSAAASEQAQRQLSEAAPLRAEAEQRHGEGATALHEARSKVVATEAAYRLAIEDRDFRRRQIEVAQLTERRDRVANAQTSLARADEALGGLRVTDELVVAIDAAHLEQAGAAAAASASAASVVAVAHAPVEVEVDGRTISLDAGQREELAVTGSVEISVPGVVTVQVRAGVEATERAARLAAANLALAQRCSEAGVAHLAEARAASAARHEAAAARSRATEAIARDLRDLTFAALSQKVLSLQQRVAAYEATRPAQPAAPADHNAAKAHACVTESALAAARARVALTEEQFRTTELSEHRAQVAGSALAKEQELAQAAEARDQRALDEARAQQSDHLLYEAAVSATRARSDADASVAECQRALRRADADAVERALAEARRAHGRADAARSANEARLHALRGALEAQGEQGRSQELDEASTRKERLVREVSGWESRAQAARRLHQAFEDRRSESRRRYEAPLRKRIEELGRMVFGPTLEVHLGTDLAITARTLHGVTVGYDQLSTGAKEQFAVLGRLACATLVAPDAGVPVVFDDVLGWTDPHRLTGLGAAITEAGRMCQVIILTCTPGRFATVAAATTIHLGPPGEAADAAPIRRRPTALSRRTARPTPDDSTPTLFAAITESTDEPGTDQQRSAG